MSSILSKPTPQPKNMGKNGHDVSQRRCFTCPVGMLLPIWNDFANPGDKYKLNSNVFVRTEAMQSAAFMRLKCHVDYFFVPITQLYSLWNEFFNGTNDNMSSVFNTSNVSFNSLPKLYLKNVLGSKLNTNQYFVFGKKGTEDDRYYVNVDHFGVPLAWNFRRLFDMLGYGNINSYSESINNEPNPISYTLLPYLAYHKIFHSHYNLTDWFSNDPSLYNVDKYYDTGVIPDSIGYPIMSTIHYRPWRKDYFTNLMPSPTFSSSFASYIGNSFSNYNPSVLNPEMSINSGSSNSSFLLSTTEAVNAGQLGFSTPSGIPNVLSKFPAHDPSVPDKSLTLNMLNTDGTPFSSSSISAAEVRSLFAYDKLMRVTAFAGGHYEDQTLAHFGYKIPQGLSKEAYKLGSHVVPLNIGEVVATASTGIDAAGGVIGDIAGKGFTPGVNQKEIHFTCPSHGFMMAIFSIEPLPEYASMGVDIVNRCSTSSDFYHPELDNVGMQPMFGDFLGFNNGNNSTELVGWTYRFSQFKMKYDVVNEGFYATDKSTWVGYKQSIFDFDSTGVPTTTAFRNDFRFLICPQYTNNIFMQPFRYFVSPSYVVTSSTQGWDNPFFQPIEVYKGDNFLCNVDVQAFKSSIMSEYSLPKLF